MAETIGFIASIFLAFSGLPQVIKAWRTKKTEDISLVMILLFVFAFTLWIIYGISISEIPIIILNGASLLFMLITLIFKLRFK